MHRKVNTKGGTKFLILDSRWLAFHEPRPGPKRTQRFTGSAFRIFLQPDWQIDNSFLTGQLWPLFKSWYIGGGPEQGFRRWLPVSQWCGHPRVLGNPIPKTLVIWDHFPFLGNCPPTLPLGQHWFRGGVGRQFPRHVKWSVIWASLVTLSLTLTQIAKVIWEGDVHITRVLGIGMPKTRGCPYHCDTGRT